MIGLYDIAEEDFDDILEMTSKKSIMKFIGDGKIWDKEKIGATIVKLKDKFYHCNYRGYPCHIRNINIKNIVSCHNMSLKDFVIYTKLLEKNNYYLEDTN